MKFLFNIIVYLFPIIAFAQNADTVISWTPSRKLRFEDFRGAGKTDKEVSSGLSILHLWIDENQPNVFVVQAVFFRNESWLSLNFSPMLQHEQVHFDIAEIFARKLRERLHSLDKSKNCRLLLTAEVDSIFNESEKVQKRYDDETEHGNSIDSQQLWNANVQRELASLNGYAKMEVKCNCR